MMSESAYLKILRESLKLCDEELNVISDPKDRAEIARHALLLRTSINQIMEWEKRQERIRCGMEPAVVYPEAKGIET